MWQTRGIREILRQLTGMFWQVAKVCLNALRKNCSRSQAGYMSKCHGNITAIYLNKRSGKAGCLLLGQPALPDLPLHTGRKLQPDQPLPTGCHHLPRQNIHIPSVRAEYSGSCLKLCTETAERRIAGDVVRVGYGEDCVDAAVAGN